ncbi:MAG: dihydroorotate dehydrogenase electron transfer subunit [Lachnospiraceae bacterium]|nr:dihydroorotate dehydrogenase electron transfer subunit [Lachnospiraceae bacterium]
MSGESKKKEKAVIIRQEEVSEGIYSMWIKTPSAREARAGQFVNLFCDDESRLMPRPISICEIDMERSSLRLVYRVSGEGTREFSKYTSGHEIEMIGPLGNGFPIDIPEKDVMIIGGGIGIPPMLQLAKKFPKSCKIVLGYQNFPFLMKEFEKTGSKVYVATESGKYGFKGNVIGAIMQNYLTAGVIYACGPAGMLRAVKKFAEVKKVPCYVSMEERMACGIGACLGCTVDTIDINDHLNVKKARVCKDGPVFNAQEVII